MHHIRIVILDSKQQIRQSRRQDTRRQGVAQCSRSKFQRKTSSKRDPMLKEILSNICFAKPRIKVTHHQRIRRSSQCQLPRHFRLVPKVKHRDLSLSFMTMCKCLKCSDINNDVWLWILKSHSSLLGCLPAAIPSK